MKTLKFNNSNKKFEVAENWNELSAAQIFQIAHIRSCITNPNSDSEVVTSKLAFFNVISKVPHYLNNSIPLEAWPDLMDLTNWIFEKPKFKENPFPKLQKRYGMKFKSIVIYGPQGNLKHSTFEEFTAADDAFLDFHLNKNETAVWKLLASLYRKERSDIKQFKEDPEVWNGDNREPFNSAMVSRNAEEFSKIFPLHHAIAVAMYYDSFRTNNVVNNPNFKALFSNSSGGGSKVGWIGTLLESAGSKFGDINATAKQHWSIILYNLNQEIEKAKKHREALEKKS